MKRNTIIGLFILCNVLFIFLQIYKHTRMVEYSYKKQKAEKNLVKLTEKKQHLTQELYALKDRSAVKKYARKKLHMKPTKLTQVKKLESHDQQV